MLQSILTCRITGSVVAALLIVLILGNNCGCSLHTTTSSRTSSAKQPKNGTARSTTYARASTPQQTAPSNTQARGSRHEDLDALLDSSTTAATSLVWCAVASGPEGKDIIWIQVRR
jgi:hypothetical protein